MDRSQQGDAAALAALAVLAVLAPIDAEPAVALTVDRRRLKQWSQTLRRKLRSSATGVTEPLLAANLQRLQAAVTHSCAIAAARRSSAPKLRFPQDLPITTQLETLARSVETHQVTVVCGATGSGKSAQLPKLCLQLGRGVFGRIGRTQPRRLAARSVAARIAAELATPLGELVDCQIRFDERLAEQTRVKVMTDGILLHEIHRDPLLEAYDTLSIDEVHERSLNIDLLIGYLKKILPRRPDLRVLLTSATIAAERFVSFFGGAACCEIPGRSFPIEVRYCGLDSDADGDPYQALVAAIEELDREDRGDILVFLPGEREIAEARDVLPKRRFKHTAVLPLYARLGADEQQRIFARHADRHIVFATDVAETSLTVPGIRHVIDSGLARIGSYSPHSKIQRLPVTRISQASADQRKGRCGRERPGICVRLYDEADFLARAAHMPPEIQRSNLAGVRLRLAAQDLGEIDDFPFLNPSAAEQAHRDGVVRLLSLALPQLVRYLRKEYRSDHAPGLHALTLGCGEGLEDALVDATIARCLARLPLPRSPEAFTTVRRATEQTVTPVFAELMQTLAAILALGARLQARLRDSIVAGWPDLARDVSAQLEWLLYPGFIAAHATPLCAHYPRYLRGIELRLDRLLLDPGKNRNKAQRVAPLAVRLLACHRAGAAPRETLQDARFWLEELRVSVVCPRAQDRCGGLCAARPASH